MNQVELNRHHELAEFLRSRRARLSPEQIGLPRGSRRRTPGLRRGEVAMLAGVSLEWYTWLEQGRDINVSVQLLESLARVLQLDATERKHLFLLALRQPPPVEAPTQANISPSLGNFLKQLGATPGCIVDARLNIIAWNKAFCAAFGDYETKSERERNVIWRLFTAPSWQNNEQWLEHTRIYLAQFRAGYARFIDDPWWARQIADLSRISQQFRNLWAHYDVLTVPEGRKSFRHPLVGEMEFDFLFLQAVDSSDLRLLIHTPRETSGTAEKIERLLEPQR
ncbi:helix-turn-helix transcriptional regulator [Ktedonosporobacter rubrisoli]|nr:helix-turn-helix transcriptional regulator [Ktedonosporobacter rubrisoli]